MFWNRGLFVSDKTTGTPPAGVTRQALVESSRPPYLSERRHIFPVALDAFPGCELCLDHPRVASVLHQLSESLVSGPSRSLRAVAAPTQQVEDIALDN